MKFLKADTGHSASLIEMRMKYLREDFKESFVSAENEIRKNLSEYLENHLNRDMFAYLAEADGKIIASSFLVVTEKPSNPNFPRGRTGIVMNVYTEKEYRRQGIASELMKMLIADAERMELDFIELKATEDGYPLYKSLGFAEVQSTYTEMKYYFIKE